MMRAMSSCIAGLKAMQTGFDVIGNNVANVNTSGFKSSRTLYSDVSYQTLQNAAAGTAGTAGGMNPSQVGYGAAASSVDISTGRNGYDTTSSSTDCYIDGDGYFAVKDSSNAIYFTRVGDFKIDDTGNLVNGKGARVLNSDGSAVVANASAVNYKNISIGSDGKVTGLDSDGKVQSIGTIGIAIIPNPSGLTQAGNGYYSISNASGAASYSAPGASGSVAGKLKTSALEGSNVDIANEFANMITTQRGFQANSKIITVSDTMLEELCEMKR